MIDLNVCVQSCRLRGGSGLQTGDAGSRSDAQTGGHVADQAQLSHGDRFDYLSKDLEDK